MQHIRKVKTKKNGHKMKLIIKNTSQHQTNSTTSTSQQNIPILLNTLTNTILEQALLFLVAVYTDM